MDLTSYAELAVRLVNSGCDRTGHGDLLSDPDAFRALIADRADLRGQVTVGDMEALRMLRDELTVIFMGSAEGDAATGVARLNALLISHPVHPVICGHDKLPWHLHLSDGGSVSDRLAAGAVIGLATVITQLGADRLGICTLASCHGVFIDTGASRSQRYCSDQCASRANVTAFRLRRRPGTGASTAAG
ncbi:MAG: CGNR zinc finger domain-containing protein [Actinomycetota bacterium]